MKPPFSKLQHQSQETAASQHQQEQRTAREFASPEEMLRYDAARTEVPPEVARRLAKSVRQQTPPPRRSSGWRLLP